MRVVLDAPGVAHAAGGNDDFAFRVGVQLFGFVRAGCKMEIGKIERVFAVQDVLARLFVIAVGVFAEYFSRRYSQRAVDVDRQLHEGLPIVLVFVSLSVQLVDDLLGASDGERRNHDIAAPRRRYR